MYSKEPQYYFRSVELSTSDLLLLCSIVMLLISSLIAINPLKYNQEPVEKGHFKALFVLSR